MPSEQLALQASAAHLAEAEDEFPPEPRADVERLTASATYHRRVGASVVALFRSSRTRLRRVSVAPAEGAPDVTGTLPHLPAFG